MNYFLEIKENDYVKIILREFLGMNRIFIDQIIERYDNYQGEGFKTKKGYNISYSYINSIEVLDIDEVQFQLMDDGLTLF